MPLLTMDKKGNIVQSDSRFDGVQGIGQVPEMVDADDVTALSLIEDNQVLKDRAAVKRLQAANQVIQVKKYSHNIAKQKKKEHDRAVYLEKQYRLKKKQSYQDQLYKNMAFLKAQQEGGAMEKMSGVTGYGLSADGRQQVLSQASVDWRPILKANVAFGGDVDSWGSDTGLGQSSDESVKKIEIGDFIVKEPFGPLDQEVLDKWDSGTYSTPIYYKTRAGTVGVHSWNDQQKQTMSQRNASINHASNMAIYAKQGWGYSMYKDAAGELKIVKIRYHWALPMITLDNKYTPAYTPEYVYNMPYSNFRSTVLFTATTEPRIPGISKELKYWNILAPVIKAAAKEYQMEQGAFNVAQAKPTKLDKAVATGSFLQMLKGFFKRGEGDFSHPMVKQGLLKGNKWL